MFILISIHIHVLYNKNCQFFEGLEKLSIIYFYEIYKFTVLKKL